MMAAARGEAAEYGAEGRLICDVARVTETNEKNNENSNGKEAALECMKTASRCLYEALKDTKIPRTNASNWWVVRAVEVPSTRGRAPFYPSRKDLRSTVSLILGVLTTVDDFVYKTLYYIYISRYSPRTGFEITALSTLLTRGIE